MRHHVIPRSSPWGVAFSVAVILLVAAGCQGDGASAADRSSRVFRMGLPEPGAIDPAHMSFLEDRIVIDQLFDGLVTLDHATGVVAPGLAERWNTDEGCRTWTFQIRRGTAFSNGEEVTAASFVAGMTRAAQQEAHSPVAYIFADVAGYEDIFEKGSTPSFAGLSAPDPGTLTVRLARPDCDFATKALHPVMSPVPSTAGKAGDEKNAFAALPVGNGPFRMKEPWRRGRSITLVRNERYAGPRPALDEVRFIIGDPDSEYRRFQAGLLDYAAVPEALVPQARAIYGRKGGLLKRASLEISYLIPQAARPPFDHPDARRAVSLAIDRDLLVRGLFRGAQAKATSLLPPALGAQYREGVCDSCRYDPKAAREAADRAGLRRGTRIRLLYQLGGSDASIQFFKQQLEDNLGLRVDLERADADFRDRLVGGDFELAAYGWLADYPSADSFLSPLLSSKSADNHGDYKNEEVDRLLAEARQSRSGTELLHAAERLAIGRDVAVVPLWNVTNHRVFRHEAWTGVEIDGFAAPTLATLQPR